MITVTPFEFLATYYPDPVRPGQLVVWSKTKRTERKHTDWCTSLRHAARLAERYRHTRDVYFGVGLQDRVRVLRRARRRRPRISAGRVRGGADTVTALPALWADIDVAGPGHAAANLPPGRGAALELLAAVPQPPSVLVWTGGGFHVYWLFKELWVLDDDDERRAARQLLRRLQWALQKEAAARGWQVDPTADLARVMRLPGTFNLKGGGKRPVVVERFPGSPGELRYVASDFDLLEDPPEADDGGRPWHGEPYGGDRGLAPSDLRLIWDGCSYLRAAYRGRARRSEFEWYRDLALLSRCEVRAADGTVEADGRALCHRFSQGHPGYSPAATDDKIDQALSAAGPPTCETLAHRLGGWDEHCSKCPHWGDVKSPIVLGRRTLPVLAGAAAAAAPAAAPETPTSGAGDSGLPQPCRPQVVITTREHEVNDQAMAALAAAGAGLYERGGLIVEVVPARPSPPTPLPPAPTQPGEGRPRPAESADSETGSGGVPPLPPSPGPGDASRLPAPTPADPALPGEAVISSSGSEATFSSSGDRSPGGPGRSRNPTRSEAALPSSGDRPTEDLRRSSKPTQDEATNARSGHGSTGGTRTERNPTRNEVEGARSAFEHRPQGHPSTRARSAHSAAPQRPQDLLSTTCPRGSQVGARDPAAHALGAPVARPLVEARFQEILARHIAFVIPRTNRDGIEHKPAHPPRWCTRGLLARGHWPELPHLEGVVEGPVLRADGSVLQEPGYDPATGLVYVPGTRFQPVPEAPSQDEIDGALALLRETVCDFPFESELHFSTWLAALLTPLARPAFEGPAPLFLIDANVRGAGKSLLADVVSAVLTGRPAARMSYSRDEDELRKAITGLAVEGAQLVLIDNVSGVFGSPTLDRALTADRWRDRLLGSNDQVELPLRMTWLATGNNVGLSADTPRRCLHVRLESPRERPEERTRFRHRHLLSWVRGHRGRILPAALVLLRAYVAAGRPPRALPGMGSYEGWSDLVRQALVWHRLPDPAASRGDLELADGGEVATAAALLDGLEEIFSGLGGRATAREIVEALAGDSGERFPVLRAALRELFPRIKPGDVPTARQLGIRLRRYTGRIVDGRALVQAKKSTRGVTWALRSRTSPPAQERSPSNDLHP